MANSVNNKIHKPRPCTPDTFAATLTSIKVAQIVGEVRAIQLKMDACEQGSDTWKMYDTEKKRAKKKLPIFCFHAEFDGERTNECAHSSGLSSIDVDHIKDICTDMVAKGLLAELPDFSTEDSPRWAYRTFIQGHEEEWGVALVNASCSGDGLRVVFVKPADMDVPQSQEWFCAQSGLPKDEGVKDLARASYAVTQDDVFYIHEDRLFHTPVPGDDDPANVTNRLNLKGNGVKKMAAAKRQHIASTEPPQGEYNPNLLIDGVPVTDIVNAYWLQLRASGVIAGKVPVEGERHNSLMKLARDLAPYLNMDANSVMSALPRLKDDEKELSDIVRDSLDFITSHDLTKRSKVIANIIKDIKANDALFNAYPTYNECIAFEESLPRLPKSLQLALKILAPGYRFPAMMVILALSMCLADRVLVKMGKFKAGRLRGVLHVDGLSGSGKGVSFLPAKHIRVTLKEKNDKAMIERSNWKADAEKVAEKKKKGEKAEREKDKIFPDIRIMPRATTDNGQMEIAQHGRTLLTMEEELAGLVRQFKKSSYDRSAKLLLAFDGTDDGNLTQVASSINRNSAVNWVVITSGTRSALNQLIKHNGGDVCDGLVNRLAIVLLPRDNERNKLIDEYSETDEERLRKTGEMLSEMHGTLRTPRLDKALEHWKERFGGETMDAQENVKQQLNGRVALIAFRFACAMQLFYEIDRLSRQEIDECSFDMSEVKEQKCLQEWGTIFADYFLDKQFSIFGNAMIRQNLSSFNDLITTKSPSWLDLMPTVFSYADMEAVLGKENRSTFRMKVKRTKATGLIECIENGKTPRFRKLI